MKIPTGYRKLEPEEKILATDLFSWDGYTSTKLIDWRPIGQFIPSCVGVTLKDLVNLYYTAAVCRKQHGIGPILTSDVINKLVNKKRPYKTKRGPRLEDKILNLLWPPDK